MAVLAYSTSTGGGARVRFRAPLPSRGRWCHRCPFNHKLVLPLPFQSNASISTGRVVVVSALGVPALSSAASVSSDQDLVIDARQSSAGLKRNGAVATWRRPGRGQG